VFYFANLSFVFVQFTSIGFDGVFLSARLRYNVRKTKSPGFDYSHSILKGRYQRPGYLACGSVYVT